MELTEPKRRYSSSKRRPKRWSVVEKEKRRVVGHDGRRDDENKKREETNLSESLHRTEESSISRDYVYILGKVRDDPVELQRRRKSKLGFRSKEEGKEYERSSGSPARRKSRRIPRPRPFRTPGSS